MQRRLAEELRALRLDNKATLLSPGGVIGYDTSIQKVASVSVAATAASLVFPSCGSSSSSSPTSLSSSGSAVVSPSSEEADESYKLLRTEAFRENLISEIASHMVSDGYTEGLITEFSRASRRQSWCSGGAILRTWFSELGVDWVLGVDDWSSVLHDGETWSAVEDKIKQWAVAFTVMAEALRLTRPALLLGSDDDGSSGGGLSRDDKNSVVSRAAPPGAAQSSSSMSVSDVTSPGSSFLGQESWSSSDLDQQSFSSSDSDPTRHRSIDIVTVKQAMVAYSAETRRYLGFGQEEGPGPQGQFVTFARASLQKMLRFPPVVAAQCRSPEKILCVIDMYSLITDASPGLLALLSAGGGTSKEEPLSGTLDSVLQTMSVAVWEILQSLTKLVGAEDSWRTTTMQQASGDIHPVNQYTVNYINLLLENCTVLDSMLQRRRRRPVEVDDELASSSDEAFFVLEEEEEDAASLTTVVVELIMLLDAMLEEKSRAHAAGRGYIFLLNNAYFILQQAEPALRKFLGTYAVVYRKQQIERYIGRYLDASWGPVTACLRGRWRVASALVDFNASFQATYQTQMFWKINCPQLRSRLRGSVSDKVVPAYRAYLEAKTHALQQVESSSDTYTPEDLEELFQDLFEG